MHIRYFLARNNRWYLATSSNFQHTGHPYLPPSAVPLSEKDMDPGHLQTYKFLYDARVNPTQTANIMSDMVEFASGGTQGTFLPKTIFNMNARTKRMQQLAGGVTTDITDAEKY